MDLNNRDSNMSQEYIKIDDLEVSTKPIRSGTSLVVLTSKDSINDYKVRLNVTFNRVYSKIYDTNKKELARFEDWTPDEALDNINYYLRFHFYHKKR